MRLLLQILQIKSELKKMQKKKKKKKSTLLILDVDSVKNDIFYKVLNKNIISQNLNQ